MSAFKGDTYLSPPDAYLLWDSYFLKVFNQRFGTAFNINAIPASIFAVVAFAFNEAAYASGNPCSNPLLVKEKLKLLEVWNDHQCPKYTVVIIPNVLQFNSDQLLIGLTTQRNFTGLLGAEW